MNNPMTDLFSNLSITSNGFFFFVLAALGVYYLVPKKAQNHVLLIASYLFCFTWDWTFAAILLASSIVNFWVALKLDKAEVTAKTRWVWIGVAANLGVLLFYKYFDQTSVYFFKALLRIGLTNELLILDLLQPIGISFYTPRARMLSRFRWNRRLRPIRIGRSRSSGRRVDSPARATVRLPVHGMESRPTTSSIRSPRPGSNLHRFIPTRPERTAGTARLS